MDRNDHEAALRLAEALEKELQDLRAQASQTADMRGRVAELERDVAEARARLGTDARRLDYLEGRTRGLRARMMATETGEETAPSLRLPSARDRIATWRRRAGPAVATTITLAAVGVAAWFAWQEPTILRYPKLVMPETAAPAPDEAPARPSADAPHDEFVYEAADETADHQPGPPSGVVLEHAKAEYTKGLRLFAASHEPEAMAAFHRSLHIEPRFPDPHRALGTLYARSGDLDAMCEEFALYIMLSPHAGDTAKIKAEMAKYAATVPACDAAPVAPAP
jgi:hypothetical protein